MQCAQRKQSTGGKIVVKPTLQESLELHLSSTKVSQSEAKAVRALCAEGFVFLAPEYQIAVQDRRVIGLDLSATFAFDLLHHYQNVFHEMSSVARKWRAEHPEVPTGAPDKAFENPQKWGRSMDPLDFASLTYDLARIHNAMLEEFATSRGFAPWLPDKVLEVCEAAMVELQDEKFALPFGKTHREREQQRKWIERECPFYPSFPSTAAENLGVDLRKRLSLRASSLPPEIVALSKLERLDLSFHRFTKVPEPLCKLSSLRTLNVSENELSDVRGLEHLTRLRDLNVYGNHLGATKSAETSFHRALRRLDQLTSLNAGRNHLSQCPSLSDNLNLRELKLRRNELKQLPGKADLPRPSTSLIYLDVDFNGVERVELDPKTFSRLEVLKAAHNAFSDGPEGYPLDFRPFPFLRKLDLSNNGLFCFPHLPDSVTHLNLGNNPLGDYSTVSSLPNLQRLRVKGGEMAPFPVEKLDDPRLVRPPA